MKVLQDKDLTKADKKRIAIRKLMRKGSFWHEGSRRMKEIEQCKKV